MFPHHITEKYTYKRHYDNWLPELGSCYSHYVVEGEDEGAAMRFLIRSDESSWNPASATEGTK